MGFIWTDKNGNRIYPSGRGIGNLDTGDAPYKLVNPKDGTVYDLSQLGSGSSYGDEDAQDAVGTILGTSFTYSDSTPSIDLASGGVDTAELAADAVTSTKIAADAVVRAAIATGAVGQTELDTEETQDLVGGMAGAYLAYDDANNQIDTEEIQWLVDHPDRAGVVLLEDTEAYDITVPVPAGETLEVYRWGVWKVADYTAPTGLEVQLLDGGDTVQASANTTNTQSTSSPVASYSNSGSSTALYKLRLSNATGSALTTDGVDGHFGYRVV